MPADPFLGRLFAIPATIRLRADERLDPGSRWHYKPSADVVRLRGRRVGCTATCLSCGSDGVIMEW